METNKFLQTSKVKIATTIKCLEEDLKDYRHKANISPFSKQVQDISEQLQSKGYAIIPNYYDQKKCDEIKAEIDRIIEEYPEATWVDEQNSDHRLFGVERVSEKAKEFNTDSFLLNIANCYLKTNCVNNFTLGARLTATENNLGSGGGWHRDSEYEKQFKSIIYLSNVDQSNGPFQYLPKTNNIYSVIKTVGFNKSKRFQEQNIEKLTGAHNYSIDTITGSAGTLLLVDTRGIHRGMPIKTGNRYALTNYFSALHRKDDFQDYFGKMIKFPKV